MKKITILITLTFLGLMPLTAQWVTVGIPNFSDTTCYNLNYQDLAVDSSGVPYVAYMNLQDSGKVTVMKYFGGSWTRVGNDFPNPVELYPPTGFFTGTASSTDSVRPRIAFDNFGNPYVGYVKTEYYPIGFGYGSICKLNVVKFNGISWVPVGILSDTVDGSFDLAIDRAGNPYVVYVRQGGGKNLTVMKYISSNWSLVGSIGIDSSQHSTQSIAFDTFAIPYVLYNTTSGQGKIQKYTGIGLTGWQFIITPPSIIVYSARGCLAIGNNNTLYAAALVHWGGPSGVAEMNGVSWNFDTLSGGSLQTLALDKHNNPFFSYDDAGFGVRRYDSAYNNWVNEGFTPSVYSFCASIDNSGAFPIPYVAYIYGSPSNGRLTVQKYLCQSPSVPQFNIPDINICKGDTITTMEFIPSDTVLNDAEYWQWYSGSCGGTPIGRGLHVTLADTVTTSYYVRGEGYCVVPDSCSRITVNVHTPVPGYSITSSGPTTFCSATTDTLNAGGGYTSYEWSTGSNRQTIYPTVSNVYGVTVTDSNGCVYHDTVSVNVLNTIPQSICIVSVDSASGYNNIVWDQTPGVDSFKVYAQTSVAGIYQLIGDQSSSLLSTLLDSTSNPAQQSSTYVITAVNQCGESGYSAEHQTIHLSSNLGVGGSVNLIWNAYTGFSYPSFYIYRGSSATNMQQIATIPSTNLSYTDLTPPAPPVFYQVSVTNPNGCSPSRSASYNSSFSNVINVNTSGINSINYGELHIYCKENGYNTIVNFSIIINIPTLLKLYDLTGRMVFEQANFTGSSLMLPSNLSKGIYLINVQNDNLSVTKKLIIGN